MMIFGLGLSWFVIVRLSKVESFRFFAGVKVSYKHIENESTNHSFVLWGKILFP